MTKMNRQVGIEKVWHEYVKEGFFIFSIPSGVEFKDSARYVLNNYVGNSNLNIYKRKENLDKNHALAIEKLLEEYDNVYIGNETYICGKQGDKDEN
ncbi:hypothetical protein AVV02_gp197 [Bacillus phage AvesoBmore]|uniref:Uncharacterized protein n=1 Tax=Bacillus phage AvesoBmore TaxID=1698451 RepID=A0A0K2D173_9CAUD|nr:hypothetical protein AVV02_gp197 [Bacillus phage AvesoBmore]ALA13361.1 hypothetical protein AVESOBMORE_197 [Bacillus phage AvesoBmore]